MLRQRETSRWLSNLLTPLPPAHRLRGAADDARDRRDWDAAAGFYQRYLSYRPRDAALWVQLGHAEKERGAMTAARTAYRQACALAPRDADPHLQLGHLLREMKEHTAAQEAYETAMRLDSAIGNQALADNLRALGDLARDRLDWPEAATMYHRYLQQRPDDAAIWVQHGHAEKERGALAAARAAYERAIALTPTDPDVFLQLGHVLKLLGETAAAIHAYEAAQRLNPALDDAGREARTLAMRDPESLSRAMDAGIARPSHPISIRCST
ncbi:MAG: hypothetical protein QOD93_699 [Acetobacteraceae bacterium]|jgi:tetratricopeptide (TPR) repeat protein|nr:hypothetical protein [Acetobacteraceae bacterium]